MVQITNRVIVSLIAALVLTAPAASFGECVPAAAWVAPGDPQKAPIAPREIVARASARRVVLLGEQHDIADHHRWQLQMLAVLDAARPGMVVGFEMFPRRVQGVLDRWVAGELTEAQFLVQVDWRNVWRLDAGLYMPLFHWARMNRVPMIAINIDRELTREVSEKGFDAIPIERREGVSRPAEPSADYTKWLLGVYREHQRSGTREATDPAFRRFVESQVLWDRAMAESLATAHKRTGNPLVVGILGSGHIARGYGVPHQLQAMGISEVMSLLPWSTNAECGDLVSGFADAVYGLPAQSNEPREQRARLGVGLERTKGGVLIKQVEASSIAATAGMQAGDIVVEIAGLKAQEPADVADAVQRHAPGTWLPIKVLRQGESFDLIAKFPPAVK